MLVRPRAATMATARGICKRPSSLAPPLRLPLPNGEIGTAWLLGPDNPPGAAAIGGWDETGTLTLSTAAR